MTGSKYLLFTAALVFINSLGTLAAPWKTPLTNPDFKEIFVARCLLFGQMDRTSELYKSDSFSAASCERTWKQFKASVGYKDPCSLTVSDYSPFIKHCNSLLLGEDTVYRDKTTFWSGTKPYADGASRRAGSKYLTLGSLFHGYIIDDTDISWCGDDKSPSGFKDAIESGGKKDGRVCKNSAGKTCYPISKFWETASINLATKARGKTYVILNADNKNFNDGSSKPAYTKESVFGSSELPTMDKQRFMKKQGNAEVEKSRVTELIVIAILPFDSNTPRAYCEEARMRGITNADDSLVKLKQNDILKAGSIFSKGLATYTCKDHPETEDFLKDVCRDDTLQIVRDNAAKCRALLA